MKEFRDIHAWLVVDAIKFPVVPKNKSRLRFILNAGHETNQIDRLVAIMSELEERYPQVINAG